MNHSRVFVADIGTTKVAVVSATLNEQGHLKIDGVWTEPCDGVVKGEVRNRDAVAAALTTALDKVEQDVRSICDSLFISVGGKGLQSMRTQGFAPIYPPGRALKRQDVHQVINHSRQVLMPAGTEQLMAVPTEFRVDQQRGVVRPVGMSASRLEVLTHILTVDSPSIHRAEAVVASIGREVAGVVPEPLAAALGVATQDHVDMGCIVVDLGGTLTNVAVFANGVLTHVASLPIGSSHITSDISQLLHVSLEASETLKVEHGYAVSAKVNPSDVAPVIAAEFETEKRVKRRVLCEVIESRSREIVRMVAEDLERAGIDKNPPGGYLITGGGSLLPGIDMLFQDILGTNRLRIVQPKASGGHSKEIGSPAMATVVGLARYALEEEADEYESASGNAGLSHAIRTLKSIFGSKS